MLKIIQITDSHIYQDRQGSLKGLNTLQSFTDCITHIQQHHADLDLLLATGDISQDGSSGAYQHWLSAIKVLNKPIIATAGNHDTMSTLRKVFSNQVNFDYLDLKSKEFKSWRIIVLDTALPNEEYGELADSELARLTDLLSGNNKQAILIALHHHPVKVRSAWLDNIMLKNNQAFIQCLRNSKQFKNIKAIVCGHVHQNKKLMIDHIPLYTTPSTCIQFTSECDDFSLDNIAPGYRCLKLTDAGEMDTFVEYLDSIPALDPKADYN